MTEVRQPVEGEQSKGMNDTERVAKPVTESEIESVTKSVTGGTSVNVFDSDFVTMYAENEKVELFNVGSTKCSIDYSALGYHAEHPVTEVCEYIRKAMEEHDINVWVSGTAVGSSPVGKEGSCRNDEVFLKYTSLGHTLAMIRVEGAATANCPVTVNIYDRFGNISDYVAVHDMSDASKAVTLVLTAHAEFIHMRGNPHTRLSYHNRVGEDRVLKPAFFDGAFRNSACAYEDAAYGIVRFKKLGQYASSLGDDVVLSEDSEKGFTECMVGSHTFAQIVLRHYGIVVAVCVGDKRAEPTIAYRFFECNGVMALAENMIHTAYSYAKYLIENEEQE